MKNSIYFRNFIVTSLIVLISFTLLGGLFFAWIYARSSVDSRTSMENRLHQVARFVATQHDFNYGELSDLNLCMLLSITSELSGYDFLVTNTDGLVQACSEKDLRHIGKQVPLTMLDESSTDGFGSTLALPGIYEQERQVVGVQMTGIADDEPFVIGYMFMTSDVAALREASLSLLAPFAFIALVVMSLSVALSFVATKKQASPLHEIAYAVHRFARGDFSTRVKENGRIDEIGKLAQAFNAMADTLESSETNSRNFIANLSHELKTPMTIIAGFAEGLLDGTIPAENGERYLMVIASETRRLARLVGDMLGVSTLQSQNDDDLIKSSFDISEVMRLALLSLSSKIESRSLDVEAELPEEAITTQGDKDSITQVTYNLIDNAIKYSTVGGAIGLKLWKQGGKAFVSVVNRGKTIPEDELPHIFERFFKTDKSRGVDRDGVGLGLYIVKTILDKHNENIYVTSKDGLTKFMFTLTVV